VQYLVRRDQDRRTVEPRQASNDLGSRKYAFFLPIPILQRSLMSRTTSSRLVDDARQVFSAAVRRVQADRLLEAVHMRVGGTAPLHQYDAVRVIGMGKAAMAMAGVLEVEYGRTLEEGLVVVPEGAPDTYPKRLPVPNRTQVIEGGHPLPNEGSVRAGRRLLEQARAAGANDLLLVPVSGGGTALTSLPVEAVGLPDLKATYHLLLTGGVPIRPANVVRKHLTQVGGGQLAQAAHPADLRAFVVSDVVGDDLATIASGPTVPDPSTYEDAMRVLYRHGLWHEVPDSVRVHLANGARGECEEPPDGAAGCFGSVETAIVGSNDTALRAARETAVDLGYQVRPLRTGVEGEARVVARDHVAEMLEPPLEEPSCWLWGGEPTVTVEGEGTGGRNQELVLGAALALDGAERRAVLLSGGTDGIDGPTDAAGAWATPETAGTAREAGLDPRKHLDDNNAYPFFDALGQLLRPGPTHTNVMDVQVGLVAPGV